MKMRLIFVCLLVLALDTGAHADNAPPVKAPPGQLQTLIQAINTRDEATALPLAKEILQHDPLERGDYGLGNALRKEAITALGVFGQLEAYQKDINDQLKADPNSLRLTLLAAETQQHHHGREGRIADLPGLTPPLWLKLARNDDMFTASWSKDGTTWKQVFGEEVEMKPGVLAGLIASPNSQAAGHVTWKNIAAKGEPMAGAATLQLPAPWQYADISHQPFSAGAQWDGTELKMDSPISHLPPPFFFESIGCVYRPLQGDGEISAYLESLTAASDGSWAGLCLRELPDDVAPLVEFSVDHNARARWSVHTSSQIEAVRLYKRAAELAANNPDALGMLATQIGFERRPDDAAAVRVARYLAKFPTEGIALMDALPVFESAGRLEDFVKAVEASTPEAPSRRNGLLPIGDDLRVTHHFAEAERIYRKALAVADSEDRPDVEISLIRLLISMGKPADAAEEFAKGDLGEHWLPWSNTTVADAVIDDWYHPKQAGAPATIDDRTVPLLELANGLGLYGELKQKLDARAGHNPVTWQTGIDPCREASILLAIIHRDPAYRPELDKLIDEIANMQPPPPSSYDDSRLGWSAIGINGPAFLRIGEQLAQWPSERAEALRLARADYHARLDGDPNNSRFRMQAEFPVLRAALAAGDDAGAQEIARDIAASAKKMSVSGTRYWPIDSGAVVRAMIREGMFADAAQVLADAEAGPPAKDPDEEAKMSRIQKEMTYAQGNGMPDGLVYGLAPGTGANEEIFYWQMNAGETGNDVYPNQRITHPQQPHIDLSDVLWTDTVPVRPSGYRIDLMGGLDESHLAKLATVDGAATIGHAPVVVPPGTRIMKALLYAKAADATPFITGSPVVLGDSENLLQNPRFEASPGASGLTDIPGWLGLLPYNVTQATGGPLPSGQFQVAQVDNDCVSLAAAPVSSAPIPLKPGMDYLLSAWQHDGMAPRFLFLDAKGVALREFHVGEAQPHAGWQWCEWRLTHRPNTNDVFIPMNAATVQILFSHTWRVAGLSFEVVPPL